MNRLIRLAIIAAAVVLPMTACSSNLTGPKAKASHSSAADSSAKRETTPWG